MLGKQSSGIPLHVRFAELRFSAMPGGNCRAYFSPGSTADRVYGHYLPLCLLSWERESIGLLFRPALRPERAVDYAGTRDRIYLLGLGLPRNGCRDVAGVVALQ